MLKIQLFYLARILKIVWKTNLTFQSDCNSFLIMNDLKKLELDVSKCVINPTATVDVLTQMIYDPILTQILILVRHMNVFFVMFPIRIW